MTLNQESIKGFLEERMGLDTNIIEDGTPLFSSEILDSFSMIEVIMFLEKSADIRFKPSDVTLDNLDTIERMLSFITAARND